MKSIELQPSPPLHRYVKLIWCCELDDDAAGRSLERIVPDGIVELVLHYRTPLAVRFDGTSFVGQPRSSLITQTRRFIDIAPRGQTGFVSVRFYPWGAHHFFASSVSALADRQIVAGDVWGRVTEELEERLVMAHDMQERVRHVERFLLEQLRTHQKCEFEPAVRSVWRSDGCLRVAELCRELGLSERALQRLFHAGLGMSPRSYLRLTRFLRACSRLRADRSQTLTDVACQCGYFDQAHFTHDFQHFAGMTPSAFRTASAVSFLEIS